MSFNKNQFEELIRNTLGRHPELLSDSAVTLLLGTAAQESAFGTYLKQVGGGPALGIFQMEPATFGWLKSKYRDTYLDLGYAAPDRMVYDLGFATLMARLRYRAVPHPLPPPDDIPAMAAYWKKWYNSVLGAGTEDEFKAAYQRYVS